MKNFLLSVLLITVFASCRKLNDVVPDTTTPVTTTPALREDSILLASLKTTPMVYNAQPQTVTTSVTGSKLSLAFNEQVQLLIDAELYASSWYIVFKEDYSKATFADFDYTTKLQWDTVSTNWKPYNLHNFNTTATDTTIGGTTVKNVKFTRLITFYKTYESAEAAQAKMKSLENKQEPVTFLTRYEPSKDTTLYNSSTVNIVYKQ